MQPNEREETGHALNPSTSPDTVKHIPASQNLAETEDSKPRSMASQAHRGLLPGQSIHHYQLVEIVGEGAFGVVWKAYDKQLGRSVAVKIPKHNYTTEREQSWFFREARAAAKLKHASIVAVYDVGQDEKVRYIVSEFIEGKTLTEFTNDKPLAPRAAAELCMQIADAVAHAHHNGIIHRDLKPSNILIDDKNKPHLLDFGLAKLEVIDQTLTADDLVLGTPAICRPSKLEARRGRLIRERMSTLWEFSCFICSPVNCLFEGLSTPSSGNILKPHHLLREVWMAGFPQTSNP